MILPPFLLALTTACSPNGIDVEQPEATACESGFILDGSACVPEACGTGRWGNLPVDNAGVYVDIAAGEGGDGTESAPYASIQQGLNQAGALGGGLVAVAAGNYPETLAFTTDHADVHLAGRCRDLVILDASRGKKETPGIAIDTGYAALEVDGLTVRAPPFIGLYMASGDAALREVAITNGGYDGVMAHQPDFGGMTSLVMEDCLIAGNTEYGMYIADAGTEVSLRDTSVTGTRANADDENGRGIQVIDGAALSVEGGLIGGNIGVGLLAGNPGTRVTLFDTAVRDTRPGADGEGGIGIAATDGSVLSAVNCRIEGNSSLGVYLGNPSTEVSLRDTTVTDTLQDANRDYGTGIEVVDGARLSAEGCLVAGNSAIGLVAANPGTRVALRNTTVRDTRSEANGQGGLGLDIEDGASLSAEGCLFAGNAMVGLQAGGLGTQVALKDTIVRDTIPDANGHFSRGITTQGGATLSTENCSIVGNTDIGLEVTDPGTVALLLDTTVRDTQPTATGEYGRGIEVKNGATLTVRGCLVDSSHDGGLLAFDPGTQVILEDTTVRDTQTDANGRYGWGMGVSQFLMAPIMPAPRGTG